MPAPGISRRLSLTFIDDWEISDEDFEVVKARAWQDPASYGFAITPKGQEEHFHYFGKAVTAEQAFRHRFQRQGFYGKELDEIVSQAVEEQYKNKPYVITRLGNVGPLDENTSVYDEKTGDLVWQFEKP